MATDPTTIHDRLIAALGNIQAAHGCLQGSTIANAGIIADYLGEASVTIKGIIKDQVVSPTKAEIEFEIHCDDEWVAGTCGEDAEAEAQHYADIYSQDGEVKVYRVTKYRKILPKGIIKEMP